MKILGIVGSHRKEGNTSALVQEALKPLAKAEMQTELIYLKDYEINDCRGCEGCRKTLRCTIEDDMHRIYPLLMEADALILGSPAYFYNVSAAVKALFDRCYCFEVFDEDNRAVWVSVNEALGGKYAVVLAVCEQERETDMGYTAEAMEKTLEALGYRVVSTVKALGFFTAGEARKDDKTMRAARQAGENLLRTLRLREDIVTRLKTNPPY